MATEQLDIELLLTKFSNGVLESEKTELIDKLEEAISLCNKALNQGIEIVSDSVYDTMTDYLRELNPSSPILKHVWSENDENTVIDADLDIYLIKYPMMSIHTIKDIREPYINKFKDKMSATEEVLYATKLNGHGIRVVVQKGFYKKATTRGRSTNGRDITSIIHMILGAYNEELSRYNLIELRAEVVLATNKLEQARKYNPDIKSAFTAVASLMRESTTPEEAQLLDIVFYDVLTDEVVFSTLEDKYRFLSDANLIVPFYRITTLSRVGIHAEIERAMLELEIQTQDYPYYTDGIVLTINNIDRFMSFGFEDKFRLGNMALKIGRWKQDAYSGVVDHIKWERGKTKRTPVAVLEGDGVLTSAGNRVRNVPLYAPLYILILEAYKGHVIHFRYGGEAGVIPITPDGRLVTEVAKDNFDLDLFIAKHSKNLTTEVNDGVVSVEEQEENEDTFYGGEEEESGEDITDEDEYDDFLDGDDFDDEDEYDDEEEDEEDEEDFDEDED